MDPRRVKTWGPLEVPLDTWTMDYEELRKPPEAWMMDYEGPRRPLETWNLEKEAGGGPPEPWTKDHDEARESLIKPKNGPEYVSGVRLILVIISVSVVYFLNMLDTTVLATVRLCCSLKFPSHKDTQLITATRFRPFHTSQMNFIQSLTSAGTGAPTPSQRKCAQLPVDASSPTGLSADC